jgi:NADPH:quinone reductase-like Zn-dependent oxidoreductase
LSVPAVTSWLALEKAKLQSGRSLFINDALGNVGRTAIAIAKAPGGDDRRHTEWEGLHEGRANGLFSATDCEKPVTKELSTSLGVVFDCNGKPAS